MTDPTDAQSRAFTDADPSEWNETALLDQEDSTLDDLDPPGPVKTVEQYEADGWDVSRPGPKTLAQARENLAARITDPTAPDTAVQAGAYDTDTGDRFADEEGA